MKKHLLPLLIHFAAALGIAAHASVLFFDDFESDDPGEVPAAWDAATDGEDNYARVDTDSAGIFGSPNQYVELYNEAVGLFKDVGGMSGEVVGFSFDFYEPSDSLNGLMILGFTSTGGELNPDAAARVGLESGGAVNFYTGNGSTSFSYAVDTPYRFEVVANDSPSAFNVHSESLSSGDFGIWVENMDTSDFTFVGTSGMSGNPVGRIGFRTFSGSNFAKHTYVDNVEVSIIPEPSTLVLILGVAGLAFARFRRRL